MMSKAYDHKLAFGAPKMGKKAKIQHKEYGSTMTKNKWCEIDDTETNREEGEMTIINLNENKEHYTAYNGTKVW